jgi:hypothetical protein
MKTRYFTEKTCSFVAASDDGRRFVIDEFTHYLEQDTNAGPAISVVQKELLSNGATVGRIRPGVYTIGLHGLIVKAEGDTACCGAFGKRRHGR